MFRGDFGYSILGNGNGAESSITQIEGIGKNMCVFIALEVRIITRLGCEKRKILKWVVKEKLRVDPVRTLFKLLNIKTQLKREEAGYNSPRKYF